MKRPLIILLLLLVFFAIFFYFSLGTQPESYGEIGKAPNNSHLDTVIRKFPQKYPYVYLKDIGYVLKDRRIIFVDNKTDEKDRQEIAIKSVEKELESYWKWQIITGRKNLEDINSQNSIRQESDAITDEGGEENPSKQNIFSRIFDIFKVADAVNVTIDKSKICDCDSDLLMLSGSDLHLIQTTLNPGDGAAATKGSDEKIDLNDLESLKTNFMKQSSKDPQTGGGNYKTFLVGVIDTGINYELPINQTPDSTIDYNFLTNTSDVKDDGYIPHGTYIAKIIAQNTIRSGVKLVGLKTFDNELVGNLFDNLCAILYCTKNKITVANASWGVMKNSTLFELIMQKATNTNTMVVCSAGNDSVDIDVKSWYPACYADNANFGNNIFSVTSKHDSIVCENTSSSEKKIDLSYEADQDCKIAIPDVKGSIVKKTGTSYATPYITAALAIYMQSHPTFTKANFVSTFSGTGPIKKFKK
ncbi:MAG: S8/S53 family peptidase [Arcicella sp.]|nr:S8/S53 family peptidase [Arcicella sp.]